MRKGFSFGTVLLLLLSLLTGLLCLVIIYPQEPVNPSEMVDRWQISGNDSVDHLFVGSNDILYTIRDNELAAISSDGNLSWKLDIPGNWRMLNSLTVNGYATSPSPVVAEADGNVYVYVVHPPTDENVQPSSNSVITPSSLGVISALLAISPDGSVDWQYNFTDTVSGGTLNSWFFISSDITLPYAVTLTEHNGRLYLYHNHQLDVLDKSGGRIFSKHNLAFPPAIGEDGMVYYVLGGYPDNTNDYPGIPAEIDNEVMAAYGDTTGVMPPTSLILAYNSEGMPAWRTDIGQSAALQPISESTVHGLYGLPLYYNGTVIVPIKDGVVTLDRYGTILSESRFEGAITYSLFDLMPVDDKGNIYMTELHSIEFGIEEKTVHKIASDGNLSTLTWVYGNDNYMQPIAAKNGLVYVVNSSIYSDAATFQWTMYTKRFDPDRIIVYDLGSGNELWGFTIPEADKNILRIDRENIKTALPSIGDTEIHSINDKATLMGWKPGKSLDPAYVGRIQVYPGDNVTYLDYYWAQYESPIIYGKSRCIYARGLYAIDDKGNLLWEKPLDSLVTAAAVDNSTLYYATSDGRVWASGAGIATGIAAAATIYIVLRLFLFGAVSRARSRIDKNENRNAILKFIVDSPGATAADISRGLAMNLGTIRYHLLILSLNHKVVIFQEDSKYLRYFTNAGTSTEAERLLLSLMRREPLRRALLLLAVTPGMSSQELAKALNISTTSAHYHISELYEKGIVEKVPNSDRGYSYFVKGAYRDCVTGMPPR